MRRRGRRRGGRRGRLHHQHDRLPGGPHRPELPRPAADVHGADDRQLRRRGGRRRVDPRPGPGDALPRGPELRAERRGGLLDWLMPHGIVALAELDTRALVRHLRDRGAMLGVAVGDGSTPEEAAGCLAAEPPMAGRLLADLVSGDLPRPGRRARALPRSCCSTTGPRTRSRASWPRPAAHVDGRARTTPRAEEILAHDPDGILLANGPGDPGVMDAHVEQVRALVEADRPLFGICLGHQLLGRALGLETFKLRFGHRGANHPVLERRPAACWSRPRTTASRSACRGRRRRRRRHPRVALRPHGRGPAAARPRVSACSTTPRPRPGPHDARDALVRFVDGRRAARLWPGRPADAPPRRPEVDRHHRLGPDRDRPGLRVRLLRRAGAARCCARRATGPSWSTRTRRRS